MKEGQALRIEEILARLEDVQAAAIAAFLVDKLGPGFWEREAENRRPLAAGSVK